MTLRTQFIHFILKLTNAKKIISWMFRSPLRSKSLWIPSRLKRRYDVHRFEVANRTVVTFQSKAEVSNQHIIFLHGGGYALEAVFGHWWIISQLLSKTKFKLTFIDYPLVPEANAEITHQMMHETYQQLLENHPKDTFHFVGDSAGGGLSLAFAQTMRDKQEHNQIGKLALLSPWVDATMSNPEISDYDPRSLILETPEVIKAGKKYASQLPTNHYLVSPIYGDMEGLKSIGVFVGTREIFLPDCRKLKAKIEATGTQLYYKEYKEMVHDWALFYVSERVDLIADIVDYLTAETNQ